MENNEVFEALLPTMLRMFMGNKGVEPIEKQMELCKKYHVKYATFLAILREYDEWEASRK